MDTLNRLDEIVENLRQRGLRLTPQRLAILKTLVTDENHPTIEEVYAAVKGDFPMTSLATVYKTIALMKELDEVRELRFDDQANRYDGSARSSHPHLVCVKCHRISDTRFDDWNRLAQAVQKSSGFQVVGYQMDVFGVCPNCQTR